MKLEVLDTKMFIDLMLTTLLAKNFRRLIFGHFLSHFGQLSGKNFEHFS